MKILAPALAVVLLGSPALAANEPKDQAATEQAADTSQNRMICKKQKVSGTRLSTKKVCMTAAQWEQVERDNREATERAQGQRTKSN